MKLLSNPLTAEDRAELRRRLAAVDVPWSIERETLAAVLDALETAEYVRDEVLVAINAADMERLAAALNAWVGRTTARAIHARDISIGLVRDD